MKIEEDLIKKRMDSKNNNSENYDESSELSYHQQNQNNYPKDIQGLFERLGIE